MQPRVTIRPARLDDLDGIVDTNIEAWKFGYGSFMDPEFMAQRTIPEVQRAKFELSLETPREEGSWLVADDSEQGVVGFAIKHHPARVEGFDVEVGALYVHPKANRGGVGTALVTDMARRFYADGHRSMVIHTLRQGHIGCGFYRKIGGYEHTYSTWHDYPSVFFAWDSLDRFLVR